MIKVTLRIFLLIFFIITDTVTTVGRELNGLTAEKNMIEDDGGIIKDENLRNAIWREIEQMSGYPTSTRSNLKTDELKKIVSLNAQDIGIEELEGIEHLVNLTHLYLQGNQIKSLEGMDFSKLNKLEALFLGNNKIKDIEGIDFSSLHRLTHLNLSGNKIKSLEGVIFPENLAVLHLQGNEITGLKGADFRYLDNLWRIDFTGNQIESLEGADFSDLNNLKQLYFSYNQITSLEMAKFPDSLRELSLDNNQIDTMDGFKEALAELKLNNVLIVGMYSNPVIRMREYKTVTDEIRSVNWYVEFID